MIFTRVLFLTTLLSLTNASSSSLRNMQEKTLGAAFLAVAKNYTPSPITSTASYSGTISAELEASAIGPLAAKLDPLCAKFGGTVDSKSQNGNETITTSYYLSCRVASSKFDDLTEAVFAVFGNNTYSYYVSSFSESGYTDVAALDAQKKALENLLVTANEIEDVMLVVSNWQNLAYYYPSPSSSSSSISINLNQIFVYPPFTDDIVV
jgi:Domain of unknown function (DUF4349)